MVEQRLAKTYERTCEQRLNAISLGIFILSKRYAKNFGKSPMICWVDDDAYADLELRESLVESMRCDFYRVNSTEAALMMAERENVVLYVSNMSRPGDSKAGITLLRELRKKGKKTPYIVFTSWGNLNAYGKEVIQSGGQACEYYEKNFLAAVYAALEQFYCAAEEVGASASDESNEPDNCQVYDDSFLGGIEFTENISQKIEPSTSDESNKRVICWVNDELSLDDLSLSQSIAESLDANCILVRSTTEALDVASKKNCLLFVSNMRRPGESTAGLTLLKKLRKSGNSAPYIVYTSRENRRRYRRALIQNGAAECVCDAEKLLATVNKVLKIESTADDAGGQNNWNDVEEFVY